MSAMSQLHFHRTYTIRRERSGSDLGSSVTGERVRGASTYSTVIHPNADSNGLSRILLILYSTTHAHQPASREFRGRDSQFCAATSGLNKFRQ